ncbi:glycosyltransferase family 25 protein [Roseovarius phycicola]|uniref:Glycosyltransferase family 25 protein n=1 Tax=Roseovarius phycicola TaxID=3080976 RepID=A0ABZ2HM97_9RHOB
MTTHAFVLHLVRATARRENAQRLLQDAKDTCGIEGEIWPAVDGSALSHADVDDALEADIFEPPYPFALKTGEIGCFLSHRQIWAEIVRRDLAAGLVLEDDVSVEVDIFAHAQKLAQLHVSRLGYVQLQNRPAKGSSQLIDQIGSCSLTLPNVTPVRASAQLISRAAAERLLGASRTFDRPVDTFVQSHWYTGFRPGVIYPSGIRTISEQLDGSTIQNSRKSLGERLHREIARFSYRRAVAKFSQSSSAPSGVDTP